MTYVFVFAKRILHDIDLAAPQVSQEFAQLVLVLTPRNLRTIRVTNRTFDVRRGKQFLKFIFRCRTLGAVHLRPRLRQIVSAVSSILAIRFATDYLNRNENLLQLFLTH